MLFTTTALAALLPILARAQYSSVNYYSATYSPSNAPAQSEQGQSGTNQCGSGVNANSECQNLYINSIDDFCLFAPPSSTSEYGDSSIGNTERIEVSYCLQGNYGARQLPASSISGAHLVVTKEYAQITGVGSLAGLNIVKGDDGGELDPHGADGNGNPIGGLVFSNLFGGGEQQIHEWTQFIGDGFFCIRICPDGPNAAAYCNHIYDTLGCNWNMPGNYDNGFDTCDGDAIEPMGVYGSSTFYQGYDSTPSAHAPSATYNCASATGLNAAVFSTPLTLAPSSSGSSSGSSTASASMTSAASSGASSASSSSSGTGSGSSSVASTSRSGSTSAASNTASSASSSSAMSTSRASTAASSSTLASASTAAATTRASGAGKLSFEMGVWSGVVMFVGAVVGGAALL